MARGKKKGRRQLGDSDEEDEPKTAAPAPAAAAETKLSRKQQRSAKQASKRHQNKNGDSDDDDDDDVANLAAMLGGKGKKQFESDSDEDDNDGIPAMPTKPAKGGRGKKKNAAAALAAAFESSEEEEQEQEDGMLEEEEDDDDDDGEVEQVAVLLADDDWGGSSKKKNKKEKKPKKDKDKKEKKHKKEKKKKKEHSEKDDSDKDDSDADEVTNAMAKASVEEPKEERKKTKFEIQMEQALKKKEDGAAVAVEEEKKSEKKPVEVEPDWVDTSKKASAAADDDEVEEYYGHGDEAWTDKSHAMKEAEKNEPDDNDILYGKDGKKLSNKERKKLLKAREAAQREAEYQVTAAQASREGQQFACSQTAVDENDPQWGNSLDINIPSFSISAAGKILFKDASFAISHGRHYGLVGPNGKGKSTLLKMIASKDLKLPPRIDFLYVEQEVVADDTPAVEAVLRADKTRWNLLQEEQALMAAIDAGDESEEKIVRLQEVVDELTNMGADAAESKARRILYGLGFTPEMQTKPTKMFSGGWRMRISVSE